MQEAPSSLPPYSLSWVPPHSSVPRADDRRGAWTRKAHRLVTPSRGMPDDAGIVAAGHCTRAKVGRRRVQMGARIAHAHHPVVDHHIRRVPASWTCTVGSLRHGHAGRCPSFDQTQPPTPPGASSPATNWLHTCTCTAAMYVASKKPRCYGGDTRRRESAVHAPAQPHPARERARSSVLAMYTVHTVQGRRPDA